MRSATVKAGRHERSVQCCNVSLRRIETSPQPKPPFSTLPGMVELHSTPPPAATPAQDDDCKSSIPGSRLQPILPNGRTTPSAITRRTRLSSLVDRSRQSASAHPRDGRVALDPAARRHAATPAQDDDCKSSIPGSGCRLQPNLPNDRTTASAITRRTRLLSTLVDRSRQSASARPRDGRVALDPAAGRHAGARRRL
jgi:hypothetical protein